LKQTRVYVITEDEKNAMKAVAAGKASAGQQQLVIRTILNISDIRAEPKVFETPLEQGFDAGKKFVGWSVARLIEASGITQDPSNKPKDA
jgi:hypothetical protein